MTFREKFINDHPLRKIQTGGKDRRYLVGGEGNRGFLVLPGAGQEALSCFDMVDAFEKQYKVIAVDYFGFRDIGEFFDFLDAVIRKEKIKSLVLYGLSLGGFLAQHYARRRKSLVSHLILSHTGSTRSKTIRQRIIIPGRILYLFLPFFPANMSKKYIFGISRILQVGRADGGQLFEKFSTRKNHRRRKEFLAETSGLLYSKEYLRTVYYFGIAMKEREQDFDKNCLGRCKDKVLILRTENDPLAQDDGVFLEYYPTAKVVTFYHTGHLTPFIQFEKMKREIEGFLGRD